MTPLEEKVARAVTQRTMEIAGFWATLPTVTAQQRALDLAYKEAEPIARAAIAVVVEECLGIAEANAHAECEVAEEIARQIRALSPTTPEGRGP